MTAAADAMVGETGREHEKMSGQDVDAIHAALTRAQEADPQTAPYGVRTSDPWPGAISLFFFYETPEERSRAIVELHPHVEPMDADERREWADVTARLILAKGPELGAEDAERIDELTGSRFGVEWIGTFDDLCRGEDAYATDMREEFRELERDDADGSPISDDERAAFAAFVREHGC